jgi:DNA-binding NtrC family response regulator
LGDDEINFQVCKASAAAPQHMPAANGMEGDLKTIVRNLKKGTEVEAIELALEQTQWNRKEAARHLNISYKALLNKIRDYGLGQRTMPLRKRASASLL